MRPARNKDGETYYVPGNMTYKEWDKAFVQGDKSGLKEVKPDDTIKEKEPSEALEYVKKYLPNSYAAMLDILKGVK